MDVRWGFLGAGSIAGTLAEALAAVPGARLAAVASADPARAERLAPERVLPSYDDLLADDGIDVVYVAARTGDHARWVRAALRAGRPVLCEKPLGVTAAEARELLDLAAARGVLLVEASMWRWHPRVRRAGELLAAGAIGAVRHVSAGFTGHAAHGWRLDPGQGGGALLDVGHYPAGAAVWALGEGAAADVSARVEIGPSGVDLAAEVVTTWTGGASAEMRCGIQGPDAQWLVVTGAEGELELRGLPFTAGEHDTVTLLVSAAGSTATETFAPASPYAAMLAAVGDRVRGDDHAPTISPAETLATAALLDAARAAGAAGCQAD